MEYVPQPWKRDHTDDEWGNLIIQEMAKYEDMDFEDIQDQLVAKVRPHEVKFRKNGFDRDLMRRLGFNLENTNVENNWILLNQADLNIPIEKLHLQKLKKVKKSRRKRKSKSRRKRKSRKSKK